jgi:hypothetical protein
MKNMELVQPLRIHMVLALRNRMKALEHSSRDFQAYHEDAGTDPDGMDPLEFRQLSASCVRRTL